MREGQAKRVYAADCGKIERGLGWRSRESFDSGLRKTVRWYLDNPAWVQGVTSGEYRSWIAANYAQRASA